MIRRQLPAITQRLSTTLDKLQRPQTEADQEVSADVWWMALKAQYEGRGVEFSGQRAAAGVVLPSLLAERVADNLLQNALAKRAGGQDIRIRASITCENGPELRVHDTGRAVPPEVARQLLRVPVRSMGGLGIGLYQAARHAESSGFVLTLAENQDGAVCFALGRARTVI